MSITKTERTDGSISYYDATRFYLSNDAANFAKELGIEKIDSSTRPVIIGLTLTPKGNDFVLIIHTYGPKTEMEKNFSAYDIMAHKLPELGIRAQGDPKLGTFEIDFKDDYDLRRILEDLYNANDHNMSVKSLITEELVDHMAEDFELSLDKTLDKRKKQKPLIEKADPGDYPFQAIRIWNSDISFPLHADHIERQQNIVQYINDLKIEGVEAKFENNLGIPQVFINGPAQGLLDLLTKIQDILIAKEVLDQPDYNLGDISPRRALEDRLDNEKTLPRSGIPYRDSYKLRTKIHNEMGHSCKVIDGDGVSMRLMHDEALGGWNARIDIYSKEHNYTAFNTCCQLQIVLNREGVVEYGRFNSSAPRELEDGNEEYACASAISLRGLSDDEIKEVANRLAELSISTRYANPLISKAFAQEIVDTVGKDKEKVSISKAFAQETVDTVDKDKKEVSKKTRSFATKVLGGVLAGGALFGYIKWSGENKPNNQEPTMPTPAVRTPEEDGGEGVANPGRRDAEDFRRSPNAKRDPGSEDGRADGTFERGR